MLHLSNSRALLHGHPDPEKIAPDNWIVDSHYLERPNAARVQLDLHRLNSGHFAVEDNVDYIAQHMIAFHSKM